MSHVKMVQVFFIAICLLSYFMSGAQTDFVVTTKRDTIVGKVKHIYYGSDQKVQVITADGKKNVYPITQTLMFKLGSDTYCPVRFTQGYVYMKVIKSGYLGLYAFQLPNQITWDGRYLLKRDGKGIELPNLGFKKALSNFLSECPDVTSKIKSGEFSKSEINELVDQYNNCINSNTKKLEVPTERTLAIANWNALETEVSNLGDFEQKADALEMITEIKSKVNRSEKIPSFLLEGLKNALKDQPSTKENLDKALAATKN